MDNVMEIMNCSSSSDDDDFGILKVIIPEVTYFLPKNENFVEETVPEYDDKQFIEHFRISRNVVKRIANEFEQSDYFPKADTGYCRISAEKSLLVFLWFAGHEAGSFRDISDRFNISISTLHSIVENVTLFLSNMSSKIIKWPSVEESDDILEAFQQMGFPGTLECLDGTHIKIDKPTMDPESYLNRKGFYSIQMQAVCDNRRKITDVFIGYPGSVHDGRVFRTSPLASTIGQKCGNNFILADSAYPCLTHLLTPYRDNGRLTRIENNFNVKLSHCRILIEHTFGMLKQKFRQLYHLKLRKIDMICHFIRACCVLHNIAIDDNFEIEHETFPEFLDNNEGNDVNMQGHQFRNYIASLLSIN